MTAFKKTATLVISTLLMASVRLWLPLSVARAEATVIRDLRTGSDQAYVRLVLETDRALTQAPELTLEGNTLRIALADIDSDLPQIGSEAYRHDIDRINLFRTSDATLIEAVFSFIPTDVRTFSLATPFRFVVDVYRPLSSTTAKPTDGTSPPARLTGKNGTPHPRDDGKSSPPGSHLGSSTGTAGSIDSDGNSDGKADRNRFQQRLLAILIIVTSIILVVILILMCVDRKRE